MHEWALLIYTICMQTAVGAFMTLELIRDELPAASGQSRKSSGTAVHRGILAIIVLGMAVSFLHLGSPFNSLNALNNLGTSWLSREILLQLLFSIGVFGLALVRWKGFVSKGWFSETLLYIKSGVVGLFGLLLIYAMARLYMIPAVPVWNAAYTLVSFYVTAAVLGPVTVIFAVRRAFSTHPATFSRLLSITARIAASGVSLQLIFLILLLVSLPQRGIAGQASLDLLSGQYAVLFIISLFFAVLQIILFSILGWRSDNRDISRRRCMLIMLLMYTAAVIGRFLFYVTYSRMGM